MRIRKYSKSPGVSHLLTLLKVFSCLLYNASSLLVEGSVQKLAADTHDAVCRTTACRNAADAVLRNMDPEVKPCDNFYQYACGGFLKSTIIPEDKNRVNIFSIINDKLQEQLITSIDATNEHDKFKHFRLVKKLYKSCMNTTAIEAKGLEPLRSILRKLGGWPVVDGDSWKEENFDWMESIYEFRNVGYPFHSFISFDVQPDLKNNTKRVIVLDQAELRLYREYLVKGFADRKVTAYYNFMVDVAVMLGAQRPKAMTELNETLSFEMNLAKISVPEEEMRNGTELHNPMTMKSLSKNFPSIRWTKLLSNLLPSSIKLDENEFIIVSVPSYISALEKLISETPPRVLANYAMWNAVANSIPYLPKNIRERELVYETSVSGRTQHPSRSIECVNRVLSDVGASVHAMYAQKYFNDVAKANAVEMVMEIQKEFAQILKEADWMDKNSRTRALEKVAAMTSHVAYPAELLDNKKLEKLYENLELSDDNYFGNFLNASRFSTEFNFGRLHEPFNKTDWLNHLAAAEAEGYYISTENSIQLSAGILQDAFFGNDRPKYMNYGAIGTAIGHEITHGFDDIGSQFDKNGNLVDWWDPSTKTRYTNRKLCIVNQYANYTVREVQLNLKGIKTQGENVADNGGIKAAYRAYNNWAKRNEPEKMLPDIEKSPQQMFWISNANVWCSKVRPEALATQIIEGIHVPGEFRVLGPFSNMPEFAKDFNCPLGSNMHPATQCSVW